MSDFYHILNRGVDKRVVFDSDVDYNRFIYNLKDFNTYENISQSFLNRRKIISEVRPPKLQADKEKLIDVLCWCLMPNHPHILISEEEVGNSSIFSKKIFGGYTMYFNKKNERSGVLFQGRSKIIPVNNDNHFLYLPFYIHLNPLDLFQPKWKDTGIKDIKGAMDFLENYKWSNYPDIIRSGKGEFSNITNRKMFFEVFDTNEKKYKKDLMSWISDRKVLRSFNFNKFE